VLCLINISDHYIEVEKGKVLAYAEEVCLNVETIGIQKVEVAEKGGPENGKREIPEHLTNIFDKSKGELNEQEQTQLSELLCEFELKQPVFSNKGRFGAVFGFDFHLPIC
jgi:hypothetical protein